MKQDPYSTSINIIHNFEKKISRHGDLTPRIRTPLAYLTHTSVHVSVLSTNISIQVKPASSVKGKLSKTKTPYLKNNVDYTITAQVVTNKKCPLRYGRGRGVTLLCTCFSSYKFLIFRLRIIRYTLYKLPNV
jgi:hypothetical protein